MKQSNFRSQGVAAVRRPGKRSFCWGAFLSSHVNFKIRVRLSVCLYLTVPCARVSAFVIDSSRLS